MINASIKIFAMNGYQHASTDDIVKEAGISKGLLFHYFGSKLGLYGFLADYCIRYMILELSTGVSETGKDYFALLEELEGAKLQALKNYPYMQQFLNSCEQERAEEASAATKEQRANLANTYRGIMERADWSHFRPEADRDRIGKLIHIMLTGLMDESIRKGGFQPEQFHQEAQQYLGLISRIAYQ